MHDDVRELDRRGVGGGGESAGIGHQLESWCPCGAVARTHPRTSVRGFYWA